MFRIAESDEILVRLFFNDNQAWVAMMRLKEQV